VNIYFSQHHLCRGCLFFSHVFLAPCSKFTLLYLHGLISGSSIPLVYMSVFVPVPWCFCCYSFVVHVEARHCATSSIAAFAQGCLLLKVFCVSR
jgi:hypothetical protein